MYQNHPIAKKIILIAVLLFWAGAAAGGTPGALAAGNWNQESLRQIEKVPVSPRLTFAVLGDSRGNPQVFGQLLRQINADPRVAFAIHVGDLVQVGTPVNFADFVQEVRHNLKKPLLAVIGNHELDPERNSQLYQSIFGPGHYSLHLGQVYFIMVDDAKGYLPPEELRWLTSELQKSQAYKIRLVFLHIPPFNPLEGGYRYALKEQNGRRLTALLARYRVTHVFAGHIHGYFTASEDGVPYTVTAGGGARLYGTDPQHYFFHYLEVTVAGNTVQTRVQPLPAAGADFHD